MTAEERIEQLEEQLRQALERVCVLEEQLSAAHKRIEELEKQKTPPAAFVKANVARRVAGNQRVVFEPHQKTFFELAVTPAA